MDVLNRKVILALLLIAFFSGYLIRGCGRATSTARTDQSEKEAKTQMWTCSMHPQIKLPKPGQCPICGMDLIPLDTGGDEDERERRLTVSPAAAALAEIQTSPVERKFVTAEVRMVGKIDYDETRVNYITAWVPGRLDRLYVDYTGVPVKKGDHMVYMYSPSVLTAQQELIQSLRIVKKLEKSDSSTVRETAGETVDAVREKLRLWGLTKEQIAEIERRDSASDHIEIKAPISGIVIYKHAVEGMYVETGSRIYTMADLSRVWVKLDVYESDLQWVRYGQTVEFRTESYPGETFRGTITFVDPILNAKTRTIKVRVIADNADGRLKPGMFVHAVVRPEVAAGGKVMDPNLVDKWMCPMHPEVIKDKPDKCDVCEMPLVSAEELGYVAAEKARAPLVIPASAPLLTGKRAVVYVRVPGAERPTFDGREVVLGPRAGDYYIVRAGLQEGETVVTRGNFKIDSALQIKAKPSMMSPPAQMGGGVADNHRGHDMTEAKTLTVPLRFKTQLSNVVEAYLVLQMALAGDDTGAAGKAARSMGDALSNVDMKLLEGEAHMAWMKDTEDISGSVTKIIESSDIIRQREAFALLSESLTITVRRFGPVGKNSLFVLKCPMAFNNRGARWLQAKKDVNNPYFGAAMPKCGEVVETLQGSVPENAR